MRQSVLRLRALLASLHMGARVLAPHIDEAPNRRGAKAKGLLALGALGVVFGDIGTSPLYAFQEIFDGAHEIPAIEHRVYGAASLVFWTLTLVVSVKYVLIVMRADNEGEGGIMALASLAVAATMQKKRRRTVIMGLGILGAALFYGDGMITPAISVLSAVEGIEVAAPALTDYVSYIAIAVLVVLFISQRQGTGKVGAAFGPVMLLWFLAIGIFGAMSVAQTPGILRSINPTYAVSFFVGEPLTAFLALGSVVLCVTGAEALYADMGQFGRFPIRLSWFAIATPALFLNYFGQAALVVRDKNAVSNPFYLLVPSSLQIPMVILATLATVIASQAVISGAFSMTQQAIQLDYLPRLVVRHTSSTERGQVYVPAVNWMLMIAVILLILGFKNATHLASAYGIAVTGTFVITTCLITVVALKVWRISPLIVWPMFAGFFIIDMCFFMANLTKFDHGGWFPLVAAIIIFSILMTWHRGRQLMIARLMTLGPPLPLFADELARAQVVRSPGTKVYLTVDRDLAPFALVQHVRLLGAVSEHVVLLQFETTKTPRVPIAERVSISQPIPGISQVHAKVGFMDRYDSTAVLRQAADLGLPVEVDECTYVVHQVSVEPSQSAPMWIRRQYLYAFMQRTSLNPSIYMQLPPDRILGVWTAVRL